MSTAARNGNLMRRRREEQGLLLVELAEKLGRSPAFVSTVEGGFVPQPKSQLAIAEALDCSPIDLWPDEWERVDEVDHGL